MIQEVSQVILKLLADELYPSDVMNPDNVKLCIPKHENTDYQIGIYLYNIQDDGTHEQHYSTVINGKRVFPSKKVILNYLIFVNEDATFGGYNKEQEERLLERMIQTFHDHNEIIVQEAKLNITFDRLDLENKIRLWQSLDKPFQPALYLNVSPVEILSLKSEDVHSVKQVELGSSQK